MLALMIRLVTSTLAGLDDDGIGAATWTVEVYEEDGSETPTGSFTTLKLLSMKGPAFGESNPGFIRLRRPTWCDFVWDDPNDVLGDFRNPRLDELAYRIVVSTTVGGADYSWRLRPQRGSRTFDPAPRLRTPTSLGIRAYDRLGALDSIQIADALDPTPLFGNLHSVTRFLLMNAQDLPLFMMVDPWPVGEDRPEEVSDGAGEPDVHTVLFPDDEIPTGTVADLLDKILRSIDGVVYQSSSTAEGQYWVVEPRGRVGLDNSVRHYNAGNSTVVELTALPGDSRSPTRWLDRGPDAGGLLEAIARVSVATNAAVLNLDPEFRGWSFVTGNWFFWTEDGTIEQLDGGFGARINAGDSLVQRTVPVLADAGVFVRGYARYDEDDGAVAPRLRIVLRAYDGTDYWLDSAGVWQTSVSDLGSGSLVSGSIFEIDVTADTGEGIPAAGVLWIEAHGPAAGYADYLEASVGLFDTAGGGGDPIDEFEALAHVSGLGEDVEIRVIPEPTFDSLPVALWAGLDEIEHPRLAFYALSQHANARREDVLTLRAGIEGVVRPGTRFVLDITQGVSAEVDVSRTFLPVGGEVNPVSGYTDCTLVEILEESPPVEELELTVTVCGDQYTWSWPYDENADGYELHRSTTPGGPYTDIVDVMVVDLDDEFNPSYTETSAVDLYAVVRAFVGS